MFGDLLCGGRGAKAGHVGVLASVPLATPSVVGPGDASDVVVGELPVGAVHHGAEVASVDEQHLTPTVTPGPGATGRLVPVQEPQRDRDGCGVEELAGQGHDLSLIHIS